jgi:hypothetical protein
VTRRLAKSTPPSIITDCPVMESESGEASASFPSMHSHIFVPTMPGQ